MKELILIFLVQMLLSCTTVEKAAFSEKTFKSHSHHMVGSSTLEFPSDSTFCLAYRNGSLYSKGTWMMKGNTIILTSFKYNNVVTTMRTSAIYFEATDKEVIVKNSSKLIYRDQIYIQTKP